MATSESHLLEIDEQFCQCSICLEQYKVPKQLPCLHRFCRNCLAQHIEKNCEVSMIICPQCRGQYEVPEGGVDGFKTDFNIENVIEYVQLHKSLDNDHLRKCCDCLKKVEATAYCFKCNDFLCKECHNSHLRKKILEDHKEHTLSLEDIRSMDLTLEKLALLKEASRCQNHPENLPQLCCKTCKNLPICLTCTYGSHKNHKIKDVSILAIDEKRKLDEHLKMLSQYKERMYKMLETVERVRQDLSSNVKEEIELHHAKYERNVAKLEADIKSMEDVKRKKETEIRTKTEKYLIETSMQMEKELEKIRKKYKSICDDIRNNSEDTLSFLSQNYDQQLQKRKGDIRVLEGELQTSMTSIDERRKQREKRLEEISLQIDGTAKRFENLTATARSVLDTGNDWTAVQCIPDICSASQPLWTEMRREYPDLETLSQIGSRVKVTLDKVSPIPIEHFDLKANFLEVSGIVSICDDGLVITGVTAFNFQSHITVINMEGKILLQKKFIGSNVTPYRFCACLSQFKVATVSWNNEMCVYDVGNDSYSRKDILKISSWPADRSVTCVATDPVKHQILIGGFRSKDVYVFTEQLDHTHTVTLTELTDFPFDMTISDDTLLVCDYEGGRAYAFSIDGSEVKLLQEFMKPYLNEVWSPVSVSTDKNRFVYMLWKGRDLGEGKCIVRYSPDGRQMTTLTPVENDASCITIQEANQTEKLVIATEKSGQLHIYDLGFLLCNETN